MAFNKRTWKGRQGTGLNKFSINGATPVTVINQPDSVTEQGDALSAGNLNDLEDRIYDAFDDIADGTQIVGKATADASGNVITTTYATKSELTSEATARANADSNLLSAIQANSKRITNLETKAGDEIPVTYPSPTYGMDGVPANVAQYAKVTKLRGVSRVDNNAVKNGTFDGTTNWNWNSTNIDVSVSDGILEMTMKGDEPSVGKTAWGISQAIGKMTAGHIYLICAEVNSPSGAGCDWNNQTINASVTANTWSPIYTVRTAIDHSTPTFYLFPAGLTNGQKMKARNVHIRDLNVEFGTSDLSFLGETDSAKLATIQRDYPELLIPSDYNAGSLVSTTYSAVKSVGVNIWDEEWEVGFINDRGQNESASDSIRSKNYIPCHGGVEYYFGCQSYSSGNFVIYFYDGNKNMIPYTGTGAYRNGANPSDGIFTSPVGTCYMRFRGTSAYGNTYKNDIQICLDSLPTSIKTTYHPYMVTTLSFPSTSLKSAGSVRDTLELNVEVEGVAKKRETQRISPTGFDLGTITSWVYDSTYARFRALLPSGLGIKVPSSARTEAVLIPPYICKYNEEAFDSAWDMVVYLVQENGTAIYIHDHRYNGSSLVNGQAPWLDGVLMYYPLATPVVTLSDPILDPFIQVEGGGTIEPVQSQSIKIDHAFTAEYLSLGA